MKAFGWCFIGAGSIASKVAKELMQSSNNRIVSVWNRTHQKAIEFANAYGAKAYENVIDAISDPNVEGVYIALTNDQHYEYMKLCIAHHKPVLCEKPFVMNETQAKEIFALAEKEGVYVSEAMWTWHNKTAYQVRQWVLEKAIGNVKDVQCCYGFPLIITKKSPTRLLRLDMLGGCLLDIGIYGIRYTLELFGIPNEIKASSSLKDGVDMNEEIIFFYDGFKVTHRFSIDELLGETYRIEGDEGVIESVDFHHAKEASLSGTNNEKFEMDDLLYDVQFTHAAKEIRSGALTSDFVTKENTIACMYLMDECRRQMGVVYPGEELLDA